MREWQSLAHVKGECKYHVVIVPKYRRKALFGHVRKRLGNIFRQLCRQKEIELVEGHVLLDHVHMVLSIPPKLSVAMAVGYLKGRSYAVLEGRNNKGIESLMRGENLCL